MDPDTDTGTHGEWEDDKYDTFENELPPDGDELSWPEDSAPPEAGPRPSGAMWLYYLFLRPAVFFRHFVIEPSPGLTALAAWVFGTSEAIGEIEERAVRADAGGSSILVDGLTRNWTVYWGFCLAFGALSGVFYFWIGGWWYRVRLQFSGAVDPDPGLARRVYLFASQVCAIPAVLYAIWETERYESPAAAWEGEDLGGLIVILCLFWSIYVSYRGVRTAFVVRKWAARVWFALLPAVVYSFALVAMLAAGFYEAGAFSSAPNVDRSIIIDRTAFALRYPMNWDVDTADEDYDPDHRFGISSSLGEAVATFTIHDDPVSPEDELDASMAKLSTVWQFLDTRRMNTWGGFDGAGLAVRFAFEGTTCDGVIFVATTDTAGFEVWEICEETASEEQRPGFELIRRTFRLKEPQAARSGPSLPGAER